MEVLAVIGKGGAGKTTTAAALGEWFARRPARVLLVDLDPQASLTDWLVPDGRPRAKELPLGIDEVLLGTCKTSEAISHVAETDGGKLDLLPVGDRMPLAERDVENRKRRREYAIADALEQVAGSYDYVLMDAPKGNLGMMGLCALTAAGHALIPFIPSGMNLYSLRKEVAFVREEESARGTMMLRGLLPCSVPNPLTIEASSVLDQVQRQLTVVLPGIPRSTRVEQAAHAGRLLGDYIPDHKATAAYATAGEMLRNRMSQGVLE